MPSRYIQPLPFNPGSVVICRRAGCRSASICRWSLRIGLSLLFAAAALHKVSEPRRFEAAVEAYELVPSRWVRALARLLPVAELGIAAGLLIPGIRRPAVVAACLLFLVYTVALSVSLARGRRHIDCGCFGGRARVPLSGALVARNAVLIAVSSALLVPIGARALVWVDAITVGAAVAVLSLLWATAGRLSITGPALRDMGGAR